MNRYDILLEKDIPEFVQFRYVHNDACVEAWTPNDEISPPTLKETLKYLKSLPDWDIEMVGRGGWDNTVYNYGMRWQFKLPYTPTIKEFKDEGIQI